MGLMTSCCCRRHRAHAYRDRATSMKHVVSVYDNAAFVGDNSGSQPGINLFGFTGEDYEAEWQENKSVPECNAYMLQHQIGCDVRFLLASASGRQQVYVGAHKVVLMARSAVFFAMFTSNVSRGADTVTIEDIAPTPFKALLTFIYTDDCELDTSNVCEVLYAAKKYIIPSLVQKCTDTIAILLSPDTVCGVLDYSILLDDKMTRQCVEVTRAHTKTVLHSSSFCAASRDTLRTILSQQALAVPEVTLFEYCIKWAEHQCRERDLERNRENLREMLGDVLFLLRIPAMSLQEFTQVVILSGLLLESEENAVFRYLTKKQATEVESDPQPCPFTVTPRDLVCFTCALSYAGFTKLSTASSHIYDGYMTRARWTLILHVDHPITLRTISFHGNFGGAVLVFQDGRRRTEVTCPDAQDHVVDFPTDVTLQPGEFTIFTEGQQSYSGDYFCKVSQANLPVLSSNCSLVELKVAHCSHMQLVRSFSFSVNEEMRFVEDHFDVDGDTQSIVSSDSTNDAVVIHEAETCAASA